ncbi:hypothetical protein VP01_662g2 [Puccinia sorghi]|uniref:Uncharacterized protein n=1 Tax=Puccinia sorghi TaxID=27349 RepID=A0A0L6UF16_9BASI|nr:hypothetical protein VP01_662g2 [Puccinia sorghi]
MPKPPLGTLQTISILDVFTNSQINYNAVLTQPIVFLPLASWTVDQLRRCISHPFHQCVTPALLLQGLDPFPMAFWPHSQLPVGGFPTDPAYASPKTQRACPNRASESPRFCIYRQARGQANLTQDPSYFETRKLHLPKTPPPQNQRNGLIHLFILAVIIIITHLLLQIYSDASSEQCSVTYSSTKAELNPLVDLFHEGVWLKALLAEIWNIQIDAANHLINNQDLKEQLMMSDEEFEEKFSNQHLINNKGLDDKTKGIQQEVKHNTIRINLIRTHEMIANSLTKAAQKSVGIICPALYYTGLSCDIYPILNSISFSPCFLFSSFFPFFSLITSSITLHLNLINHHSHSTHISPTQPSIPQLTDPYPSFFCLSCRLLPSFPSFPSLVSAPFISLPLHDLILVTFYSLIFFNQNQLSQILYELPSWLLTVFERKF